MQRDRLRWQPRSSSQTKKLPTTKSVQLSRSAKSYNIGEIHTQKSIIVAKPLSNSTSLYAAAISNSFNRDIKGTDQKIGVFLDMTYRDSQPQRITIAQRENNLDKTRDRMNGSFALSGVFLGSRILMLAGDGKFKNVIFFTFLFFFFLGVCFSVVYAVQWIAYTIAKHRKK